MEGFKKLPKQIACFKEGGSVQKEVHNFTKRDRKNVEPGDLAQDKKLIKKAFKQHDAAEHDKEPTEIKLKKGGRAKKEVGTVKKYKTGGAVTNVYEAKKKSGDLEAIKAVKDIKPGKAAAPSKAVVVSKNTPVKFCGGKSVKKMAEGGSLSDKDMDLLNRSPKSLNKPGDLVERSSRLPKGVTPEMFENYTKPINRNPPDYRDWQQGGPNPKRSGPIKPMQGPTGELQFLKKGGKVKKMAEGGATFENNPEAAQAALDTQDNVATRNMIMNPARRAKKYLMDKLSGLSPMNAAVSNVGAPPVPAPAAAPQGMPPAAPPMKKGGKAKKK
jgi:hypothetical protein